MPVCQVKPDRPQLLFTFSAKVFRYIKARQCASTDSAKKQKQSICHPCIVCAVRYGNLTNEISVNKRLDTLLHLSEARDVSGYSGIGGTDNGQPGFNGTKAALRAMHINGARILKPRVVRSNADDLGTVGSGRVCELLIDRIKAYEPADADSLSVYLDIEDLAFLTGDKILRKHCDLAERRENSHNKLSHWHVLTERNEMSFGISSFG